MTLSRLTAGVVCLAAGLFVSGCGGGGTSGDAGGVVSGSSRIGWDQRASDRADLGLLHFVMYVDGNRNELSDASCSTASTSAGFPCTASLPSMSAGQHTLEIASYVFLDGAVVESAKSAPLVVTASGSISVTAAGVSDAAPSEPSPDESPAGGRVRDLTVDGVRLRVRSVAAAERPSALAVASDGGVFIADRGGRVRLVRDGALVGETAVFDGSAPAGSTVLDVALDPQFARTRYVFTIDVVAGDPATFRVSRFREAAGTLGERAVIFSGVPAAPDRPAASLAFGPDGLLYVALDDGGNPASAGSAGSYNGKVLRLNADGTTPADRSGASPIYVSNLGAPRSLEWDPSSASLWVADIAAKHAARIRARDGRGAVVTPVRLPLADGPSSLSMYRSDLMPVFRGQLLVAPVDDGTYLLRTMVREVSPSSIGLSQRLDVSASAPVRLVRVGPDGAVYVATDTELLRIAPR